MADAGESSGAGDGAESAKTGGKGPDRLRLIAELLADLPSEQRAAVISQLRADDRAKLAVLLAKKTSDTQGAK